MLFFLLNFYKKIQNKNRSLGLIKFITTGREFINILKNSFLFLIKGHIINIFYAYITITSYHLFYFISKINSITKYILKYFHYK